MTIGFPRKFVFKEIKPTCVKRALVRIFSDLSVDLTRVVCSHIPATSLTQASFPHCFSQYPSNSACLCFPRTPSATLGCIMHLPQTVFLRNATKILLQEKLEFGVLVQVKLSFMSAYIIAVILKWMSRISSDLYPFMSEFKLPEPRSTTQNFL